MSLWAIVPAKDPNRAKSRLAGIFSPAMRRTLSLRLLEHTLQAVTETPRIARCLVISSAAEPLALARRYGAMGLLEVNRPHPVAPRLDAGLNAALDQAAGVACRGGASALLVLPGDLLLVSPADLEALIDALPPGPGLVLAPDRHQQGTNALLLRPPLAMPFLFGPQSLMRHRQAAAQRGLPCVLHQSPALSLDLDTPEDFDLLNAAGALRGHERHRDRASETAYRTRATTPFAASEREPVCGLRHERG